MQSFATEFIRQSLDQLLASFIISSNQFEHQINLSALFSTKWLNLFRWNNTKSIKPAVCVFRAEITAGAMVTVLVMTHRTLLTGSLTGQVLKISWGTAQAVRLALVILIGPLSAVLTACLSVLVLIVALRTKATVWLSCFVLECSYRALITLGQASLICKMPNLACCAVDRTCLT